MTFGASQVEDGGCPKVPVGVLVAIAELENGDTATKDELESALKF